MAYVRASIDVTVGKANSFKVFGHETSFEKHAACGRGRFHRGPLTANSAWPAERKKDKGAQAVHGTRLADKTCDRRIRCPIAHSKARFSMAWSRDPPPFAELGSGTLSARDAVSTIFAAPTDKLINMRYRRLGRSGLQVSELSLGSWLTFGKLITDDTAEDLMRVAYDSGINFFDNAEIYSRGESERVMGLSLIHISEPTRPY